jgi:hypothetical protein
MVKPRKRFEPDHAATRTLPRDINELSDLVSELESDGKGLPILLRQYHKLGARVAGFNLDPGFRDSLDALIVVDLRLVEPALLERIVGQAEFGTGGIGRIRGGPETGCSGIAS